MIGPLVLVLRVALALALYLFLCLTLWMIWQDLKRAGMQAVRPKTPALRLELQVRGVDPLYRTFAQPEVLVGRDPTCEVRLDDEAISARHAKFSFHHRQWWIEDLNSTNGTALNSVKLTTATVLTDGDELTCGTTVVRVHLDGAGSTANAAAAEDQHA